MEFSRAALPHYDLMLRSRRVVTPDGIRDAVVCIAQETIHAVVSPDALPAGAPVEDLGDRALLPGLVDTHVHINEPGRTAWEGFASATRAAAAGGITTLIDMPLNSTPVTTTSAALEVKRNAARGNCRVDCGFLGGLIPGNVEELEALLNAGVFGIKAFMVHSGIDDFPNATEADLRAAMPLLRRHKAPLLAHAELQGDAPEMGDPRRYADYLASRPKAWEQRAIELLLSLCEETGCSTHIVHLSAADALPAIARARDKGFPVTVETCPHYLYFEAESIADGDTRFKCAPPIRERENREALWEGLRTGRIDMIVSDHSPCTPDLKCAESGDFARAWGGIASLQLGLPVLWTEARRRGFTLGDVARWMSANPAALVGLNGRKGAIEPGADADLVVFDPDAVFVVHGAALEHRHKVTPYEGETLTGVVTATYLRGTPIYQDWAFPGAPSGRLLAREEA